ncbi:hypothetical protein HanRHA438_Chr03g0110381 [Helianthus annuus]|nr:hypothetical protein HanRHA438_Chr03g0110381 [Helianthus annuus]
MVGESFPSGIKNLSRKKKTRRAPPHTTTYRTCRKEIAPQKDGDTSTVKKSHPSRMGKCILPTSPLIPFTLE